MTFEDIENLSGTELKNQREAILTAIESLDTGECRKRYLQARIDAKIRDEKLAEQGRTIALLQQTAESLPAVQSLLEQEKRETERLRGLLRSASDRSERLKVQAVKYTHAVTAIAKLANDAISIQNIEQADTGE